ncbi:MAG: Dabb family protein [Clostridia bacterium]|nr:Dabb family protein [Clostridia bacterium]
MIRHVLLIKFRSDAQDICGILDGLKHDTEALCGAVDGLRSAEVRILPLESSSADVMIECTFDSPQALDEYKAHPAHTAIAEKYIKPFAASKLSFDLEERQDGAIS